MNNLSIVASVEAKQFEQNGKSETRTRAVYADPNSGKTASRLLPAIFATILKPGQEVAVAVKQVDVKPYDLGGKMQTRYTVAILAGETEEQAIKASGREPAIVGGTTVREQLS